MPLGKRNYEEEYKKYGSSTKAKKDRAHRNAARRRLMGMGRVKKGDNRDVDHKDGNPMNNSPSNVRVTSRHYNRGRNNN